MRVIAVRILAACVAISVALAGCAGQREQLVPIRGGNEAAIDLSGRWRMQDDPDEMARRIDRAVRETDGVDERDLLRGIVRRDEQPGRRTSSRRRRDVGGLAHVFLESGRTLRISQTDAGLFIAFDRSVVEEYRFGEARMARTGGAVAQRVSGWQDRAYVIETLDEAGMKLTERYSLLDGGATLRRDIVLRSPDMQSVSIVQTFARD